MTEEDLQKRLADEARAAFQSSTDPRYAVSVENCAATLFEVLHHRIGDSDLDAVGPQIISALDAYFAQGELGNLLSYAEAFSKFVLHLADPERLNILSARVDEHGKPKKLTFAPVLKALHLDYKNKNLDPDCPEHFQHMPRFAEHVARTIWARNKFAHVAPELSGRQKAQIFESVCVFLVFSIAEHFARIRASLLVAQNQRYLRNLEREFSHLEREYIPCLITAESKAPATNENPDIPDSRISRDPPSSNIAELVEHIQRLLLVGEPGAGKTTALQYIAAFHARQALTAPADTASLPFYVRLTRYAPGQGRTLASIISETLSPTTIFSSALLLLDGLNELSTQLRGQLVEELASLARAHPALRFVLASRSSEESDSLNLPAFRLQPMTDEQVTDAIRKYDLDVDQSAALQASLRGHPKLWKWACNPLHLKMLVNLQVKSATNLPQNEGQLLQSFTRQLFGRERNQRTQTDDIAKERLLAGLAFETRSEGQTSFDLDEALRILVSVKAEIGSSVDVPAFINEVIDNHILLRSRDDELRFSHELYHDYFAAREIKQREQTEPMWSRLFKLIQCGRNL